MDQYIGKFLDDRYEILEVIGNGGMAVVYKAKCHRLNRMVAIKILRSDLMLDDDIRRRFHDEAQAVAMLSSPNIVSVYDVGQYEDADYIVMELIEGITLKEYMEKRGSCLNWREALHFMTQIMQALRHAHSRNIVHRDIKPQNIMVLRDGSVKVADFGIARIMDSQKTVTTQAFGSVHYVSPEQAKGAHVDARSDIYSAGVVLYEMLTGCLPFDGDTAVSIAIQHINSVPTTPRELNPDIPVGMEQICMQSMCARLELRYPDAQAVLRDLEEFRRNPNIVFPYANPWGGTNTDTAYLRNARQSSQAIPRPGTDHSPSVRQEQPREHNVEKGNRSSAKQFQNTAALEEYEDQQHQKKTRVIFTCAVVAIVAVIMVICFMLYRNFLANLLNTGELRQVPSLINMTIDEAKEYIATEYGGYFEVICTEAQFDDTVEVGRILSQTPTGGTTTKSEMTTINVIVSSGIQEDDTVYMPSLVRRDYRTAEAKLVNDYGVEVVYGDRVYSETIDEGLIVSTDPVAGSPLEEGQTVTLYVSKGPEIKTVSMPSLIGMTEEEARNELEQLGLVLGNCVEVAGSAPAGEIIYQSVNAYTEVDPGTVVHVQVSDGSLAGGSTPDEPDEEDPDTPEQAPGTEETDPEPTVPDTPEDPVTSAPVYQITVPLPEASEGEEVSEEAYVTVSITVNGELIHNGSYPVGGGTVTSTYTGEINDIIVLIDGVQVYDFEYVNVSAS